MSSFLGGNIGGNTGGNNGAPKNAQYITLEPDATLTQQRTLTPGNNISIVDEGPGGNITINASGVGGGGAPTDVQYLTLNTNAALSNERVLTPGTNISFVDSGAGGTLTINNTYSYTPTDATTSLKGILQLSGDLGGTATNVSVLKVNGVTYPVGGALTTGNILKVSGSSTVSYGTLDLSNSNSISGQLPTANQVAQSLSNDLSGTTASASVIAIRGTAISSTTPTENQVLKYIGSSWTPATLNTPAPVAAQYLTLATDATLTNERVLTAGTNISFNDAGAGGNLTINSTYSYTPTDATSGAKGIVQLTNDLGGTAVAPSVTRINGTTVPGGGSLTTGTVLRATGVAASAWGALDLANSSAVTGQLPNSNQASQSLNGDLSGTTSAATVIRLRGTSIAETTPTNGQVLTYNGSAWAPAAAGGGSSNIYTGDTAPSNPTNGMLWIDTRY